MKTVKLKNGTEEAVILVAGTMMTLEMFIKEQPSVLNQLLSHLRGHSTQAYRGYRRGTSILVYATT